jgi:hypothetical protein
MADHLEERLGRYRADLDAAIAADIAGRGGPGQTDSPNGLAPFPSIPDELIRLEQTMSATSNRKRVGVAAAALGLVAVIVAVAVVILVKNNDDGPTPAVDNTSNITTAPTLSSVPAAVASDSEIAASGFLSKGDIGSGWSEARFAVPWSPALALVTTECSEFLSVFGTQGVFATIGVKGFSGLGQAFQQTVLVFPDQARATAMMDSVEQSGFGDCWVDYATGANNAAFHETSTGHFVAVAQPTTVGDQMEVIGIDGTIVPASGVGRADSRRAAFMRVGRAVTIIDPPYTSSVTDDVLVHMLTTIASRLRDTQRHA